VAELCARLGTPHVTLRWDGAGAGSSLQAAARAARYRLMADWCRSAGVTLLLTAHHADDQAETLLMRLARGSGVAGLACIRPVRDLGDVTLVRPLLDVRKAALVALVADAGLAAVDDPSNRDPRFDRTQARRWLAAAPGLSPDRLAEAAAHLAATEAALDWAAERAWQGRARCDADGVTLEAEGLPDEIVRRLVCRAIATLAPDARPRGPDVARLMQRLAGNSGGTLAGVRARPGQGWRFSLAPPRRRG
jgi:tRNA(Ile)-lysidine synthase